MDTYEENGIMPDPNQQEAPMPEQDDPTPAEEVVAESSDMDQPRQEEQIPAQEQADEFCDSDDGFYHGAGAGAKESMLSPVAEETTSNSSETAQQPVEEPVSPKKRRRKKVGLGKKILKCSVVTVLIVALIAAGCGISVAVTNQYWWSYYQTAVLNLVVVDINVEVFLQLVITVILFDIHGIGILRLLGKRHVGVDGCDLDTLKIVQITGKRVQIIFLFFFLICR